MECVVAITTHDLVFIIIAFFSEDVIKTDYIVQIQLIKNSL